jgi:hypothetical protein
MRWLVVSVFAVLTGCATVRPPKIDTPSGKIPVEVLSAHSGREWTVYSGGEQLCQTPCQQFVKPNASMSIVSRGSTVEILDGLYEYSHLGPVRVRAVPYDDGQNTLGIVFTSLGGMGVITGGSLALAGAVSERHPGLLTGGGITTAISAFVTLGGIFLMINSMPHAEFYAFDGETPVRIMLAPNMVTAKF